MSENQLSSVKPGRRSVHQTQWASQFAVASELCKRGYEVAFTMGNHPQVDILVVSPQGSQFGIDVKGLYKKNFWAVRAKIVRQDLFYVLAFVPEGETNRFFILDQQTVNREIDAEISRARARAESKGRTDAKPDAFPGIGWRFAESFEDEWGILPN